MKGEMFWTNERSECLNREVVEECLTMLRRRALLSILWRDAEVTEYAFEQLQSEMLTKLRRRSLRNCFEEEAEVIE
jgi:hypothetical protein